MPSSLGRISKIEVKIWAVMGLCSGNNKDPCLGRCGFNLAQHRFNDLFRSGYRLARHMVNSGTYWGYVGSHSK